MMYSKGSIALDLDGVVTDIAASIKLMAPGAGKDEVSKSLFQKEGYKPYDHIFEKSSFWMNLEAIEGSWHQINHWFYSGYDIYFVTARRTPASIDVIEEWLDLWRLSYTDVFVTDMLGKLSVLEKIQPMLFVDDNPFEVQKIKKSKSDIHTFVMKTWYNDHIIGDLASVSSLLDIEIG